MLISQLLGNRRSITKNFFIIPEGIVQICTNGVTEGMFDI